jgi:hypothetical protein
MNKSQKHFAALWKHVTGICSNKPSPLMLAVCGAITQAFIGHRKFLGQADHRRLYHFAQRIVKRNGEGITTVQGVSPLLWIAKGEWHITNADLKLWADLCLFGSRDYFPDNWDILVSDISRALQDKRRYQAWLRYNRKGGLQKEHLRLLGAIRWEVDYFRGDWVSLFVQGRRPTGNSGRPSEFARAMGWPDTWSAKDRSIPCKVEERAWAVFDELPFALAEVFQRRSRRLAP